MESVEQCARIQLYLRMLGSSGTLNGSQVDRLMEMRKVWGIDRGGIPVTSDSCTGRPEDNKTVKIRCFL